MNWFNWLASFFPGNKADTPATQPIVMENFNQWFERQGFRNFKSEEFTRYFSRELNHTPDRSLWPNIVPTLRIVDDLRDALGTPITITSSYRSPAYNRNVGGARSSFHKKFLALDIQAKDVAPQQVFRLLKKWRDDGKFKGGLGKYNTFTHIDTRGYNATW